MVSHTHTTLQKITLKDAGTENNETSLKRQYKEKILRLSKRIVEIQKPIRILDAIKWDEKIEKAFKDSHYREFPPVTKAYYEKVPLGFQPERKHEELKVLWKEIVRLLGKNDEIGKLLLATVDQYNDVVHMLAGRGTKNFWKYSCKLYGSPKDNFFHDTNTIVGMSRLLYSILSKLRDELIGADIVRDKTSKEVVKALTERFATSELKGFVDVKLSDGIVADAAAGSNYIKINRNSLFSEKDIDVLEVHEGWVHVATTANGSRQKIATWLSKGPPRCTITQEGLAVLMEVITFRSYPHRARKINDRILGIDKAEDGADAIELFNYYRSEGYGEQEAYRNVMRICRGGLVSGGAPFTKDIAYCRGFVENYNFIRAAIRRGKPELVRFLFAGKLHVRDIPLLYRKYQEGIVDPPLFLPQQFKDLSGLAVWMSFSNFLNAVNLRKVQDEYDELFAKFL
jgi:uncharacterized protein (TIGR02421 family)